jgi:chromosome segregation ATPase
MRILYHAGGGQVLKQLQTRRRELELKSDQLKSDLAEINRSYQKVRDDLAAIASQIERETAVPLVTEHAVLRYAERVLGVDTEDIKSRILTQDLAGKIKSLGSGKYPIGDGRRAVVKGNVIVSIT